MTTLSTWFLCVFFDKLHQKKWTNKCFCLILCTKYSLIIFTLKIFVACACIYGNTLMEQLIWHECVFYLLFTHSFLKLFRLIYWLNAHFAFTISQASDESSLRALENLMTEFFHSCTTNERKREIGMFKFTEKSNRFIHGLVKGS